MNEAMQKLIDAVQQASPVVWHAAYRQAWIDGIENVLLMMGVILLSLVFRQLRKKVLVLDNDVTEPPAILFWILSFGFAVIATPFLIGALDCFLNPAFAAIKNLKGLL